MFISLLIVCYKIADDLLISTLELVDTLCRIHACDKDYSFYFATPGL